MPPADDSEIIAITAYHQFSGVPPPLQGHRTKFYICCRYVHGMPIPIAVPLPWAGPAAVFQHSLSRMVAPGNPASPCLRLGLLDSSVQRCRLPEI